MIENKIWILNSEDSWQNSLIFLIHFLPVLRRILVVVSVLPPRLRRNRPMKSSKKRARSWAK